MSYLQEELQKEEESLSQKSPISFKRIKKSDCPSPSKQQGHWTKEEHQKYLQFLEDHAHVKKNNKIFKPMSEIIGTRSPSQCRSHHQKFNPMSPQVMKKTQNRQRRLTQTPSTQQEEPLLGSMEEECQNRDEIKLKLFKDDESFPEISPIEKFFKPNFNLDDCF